jgi:hypothetical protein
MASGSLKPPRWNRYHYKHRAASNVPWEALVQRTARGPAKYCVDMTDEAQEALEMSIIKDGILICQKGSILMFYMDIGRTIGASAGIETSLVYVEYNTSGDVHGCPISPEELRRLGVKV